MAQEPVKFPDLQPEKPIPLWGTAASLVTCVSFISCKDPDTLVIGYFIRSFSSLGKETVSDSRTYTNLVILHPLDHELGFASICGSAFHRNGVEAGKEVGC